MSKDLFLGRRRLFVGGDRPRMLGYSAHNLRFAWVGEECDTQVVDLETGLAAVYPAFVEAPEDCLDLATGAHLAPDQEHYPEPSEGAATVFVEGVWLLLTTSGVLTDHLGRAPLQLVPTPHHAAFSPSGRYLAVAYADEEDALEVVLLDVATRAVVGRFDPP